MSAAKTTFNLPPTIICGGGALAERVPQLQRANSARVLLVTDEFMECSGLVARVEPALRAAVSRMES